MLFDDELLPTEAIFDAGFRAARRGQFTTRGVAEAYGYTYHGADAMLNKATRLTPITKTARGLWVVVDDWEASAQTIAQTLPLVRAQEPPTPETMKRLLHALETLLAFRHVP